MNTQPLCFSAYGARSVLGTIVAGIALVVAPGVCQAGFNVRAGYDLFQTVPGTTFFGQQFHGVSPYGFTFGRGVGYKYMGQSRTSMIVNRLGPAKLSGPGTATVNVRLSYFMLRSTQKINLFGKGNARYFVGLQTGKASKGTYTIHMNSDGSGGTFDAKITLRYFVRKGKYGPIVKRGTTTLLLQDVAWARKPNQRIGVVQYANWLLNRKNHRGDFFPQGLLNWTTSNGDNISTRLASPFRI